MGTCSGEQNYSACICLKTNHVLSRDKKDFVTKLKEADRAIGNVSLATPKSSPTKRKPLFDPVEDSEDLLPGWDKTDEEEDVPSLKNK